MKENFSIRWKMSFWILLKTLYFLLSFQKSFIDVHERPLVFDITQSEVNCSLQGFNTSISLEFCTKVYLVSFNVNY